MREYRLEEIKVGFSDSFETQISNDFLDRFQALIGDINPLHADEAFARKAGYQGRVVHGMLIAGFYSKLVGLYLPGLRALLHRVEISFLKPSYQGDILTIKGEVVAVHDVLRQIEIKAEISNARGERVSRAKIWSGVRE
jgi:3-hydroxybutyryl-CoA dehydratase